jgi:hypothetical protein
MAYMSDSSEHPTETTGPVSAQTVTAAPPPPPPPPPAPPVYVTPQQPEKQNRVNQVAAWVGIVAGSVFVVAVIFGTGFMVGKHSGSGFDRHEAVMFKQRAEPPFPMGPRGDFERGPFIFRGPDFQPPQIPQPPREPGAPNTTAPARP